MIALAEAIRTLFRPPVADDRADWLNLWCGYLNFYEALDVIGLADATFALVSEPHGPTFGLVAESGVRSVGLADIVIHVPTWSCGPCACLQDFFVASPTAGRAAYWIHQIRTATGYEPTVR